ncbi:hypothetical protein [Phenylobacterium sp.]|nr:hypothetical protein [Phenylobacterium sp.]
MTPIQASRLSNQRGYFRYWMPYAYVALPHPTLKHGYLPVKRR